MNGPLIAIVTGIISLLIGGAAGYAIHYFLQKQAQERLQIKTTDILNAAEEKAKDTELQAKDKALQIRQQAEAEVTRRRGDLTREEDRLQKRREELDLRIDRLEKREQTLEQAPEFGG